ncbi:MAG: VWA domain-containing protein [Leptospirales bacterium]|nr:VWA domain-containing protein [Leptospirales bacterium]
MKRTMRFISICCLVFIGYGFAGSAPNDKADKSKNPGNIRLRIDQPVTKKYPLMEVYVSVGDNNHEPLISLVKGNFAVSVDGKEITSGLDVAGFQYTEEGVAYSLLIAGNGMMEGESIEEQLKAAIALLESLRDQDVLSVYVFGEEVKAVFEFEKKNESLIDKITKIEVLGGNPHMYDALVFSARRLNSSEYKRKVLIIMTDGRDSGSRYNDEQMLSVLDEANIPVYSVGLKIMAGQNLAKINNISVHTGGDYVYAPQLNQASKMMQLITRQILFGYRLKFHVDHVKGDNQLHQLQVKAIVKDSESNFFKNFVAEKIPLSTLVLIIIIVLIVIAVIVFIIIYLFQLRKTRKELGISKRKCPKCKQRMKDDWDECMFCKISNNKS